MELTGAVLAANMAINAMNLIAGTSLVSTATITGLVASQIGLCHQEEYLHTALNLRSRYQLRVGLQKYLRRLSMHQTHLLR